jgi:hypothetical protein
VDDLDSQEMKEVNARAVTAMVARTELSFMVAEKTKATRGPW